MSLCRLRQWKAKCWKFNKFYLKMNHKRQYTFSNRSILLFPHGFASQATYDETIHNREYQELHIIEKLHWVFDSPPEKHKVTDCNQSYLSNKAVFQLLQKRFYCCDTLRIQKKKEKNSTFGTYVFCFIDLSGVFWAWNAKISLINKYVQSRTIDTCMEIVAKIQYST